MASERSPPPSRRSHNFRKNNHFSSNRLRNSNSPSPKSSTDSIKTFRDLGQKENNQEGTRNIPSTTTTRTPPVSKNFMSPTISASSKFTSSPKKNNRNDSFSPTPCFNLFSDRTNLDHHHHHNKLATSIESRSSKDLLRSSSSMTVDSKLEAFFHSQIEAGDSHFEHGLNVNGDDPAVSSFSSASSVVTDIHPYHPKTNYLSPRPRFLHYRPRPRLGSHLLRSHKSSGEYDGDAFHNHESGDDGDDDDTDSASEQVVVEEVQQLIPPMETKTFVENDSTMQPPKRRASPRSMVCSMIVAALAACLCLSVMDSSFLALHGSEKEGSGYVGEEVWRNMSKYDSGVNLWNDVYKLSDGWPIYSKSLFFYTTNTTPSDEHGFILPEINGKNVNSLGKDDGLTTHIGVSPPFLENDYESGAEENLKKVHIFPEIEDGEGKDFPSQTDERDEETKLLDGAEETMSRGEPNEAKPEEETEIQKPVEEEEDKFLILNETEEVTIKAEVDLVKLEEEGEEVRIKENEIGKPVVEELQILNASEGVLHRGGDVFGSGEAEKMTVSKEVDEESMNLVKIEENEIGKPVVEEEIQILNASEEVVHREGDVFGKGEEEKMTGLSKEVDEEESMNLVKIEENEIRKPVVEEHQILNAGLSKEVDEESMNLVTIVGCCVVIGAVVATMVHKGGRGWFSIRGAGAEGSGAETARKKTKKSKRESLSSSSNLDTTPSYGSFMRYEKITKKNSEEGTVTTPVRRSNRIRSQITSP